MRKVYMHADRDMCNRTDQLSLAISQDWQHGEAQDEEDEASCYKLQSGLLQIQQELLQTNPIRVATHSNGLLQIQFELLQIPEWFATNPARVATNPTGVATKSRVVCYKSNMSCCKFQSDLLQI